MVDLPGELLSSQVKKGGFSTVFFTIRWKTGHTSTHYDHPQEWIGQGLKSCTLQLWERKSARQVTCVFLKLVDLVDGDWNHGILYNFMTSHSVGNES